MKAFLRKIITSSSSWYKRHLNPQSFTVLTKSILLSGLPWNVTVLTDHFLFFEKVSYVWVLNNVAKKEYISVFIEKDFVLTLHAWFLFV